MRQDTGDTTLPAMGAGTRAPTGLAAEMTSFVGRTAELQRLGELLASSRLVTVTDAGGSGKTRLALRLAAASAEAFRQGVLVVELAPLTDAAAIPPAILQALGVGDLAGESTDDGVVAALRDADVLLLLDNCEHVVEACATLVTRVLADVPTARILATSREPLEAPGEATFPLAPLRLPPSDVPLVAKQIAGYESIQLFVDRATAAQPAFVLDDSNATAVADVCRRLDGLPLALELAAARTRSMSVTDILTHLDDRFALLRRSRANWPSRQQTLRATLDWSHDMLDGDERVLFRRLAVFAGGWCLDDVIDIVGDDPISADDLVALHGRLVDRSLVVAEALLGGTTRYRLLETMREYAHARLVDAGEVEAVRRRHLARFIRVAQEYDAERTSHGSDAGLGILAMHRDNLRGALEWAKATDPEAALLLTGLLDDFWRMIGAAEGWSQLQQTLAAADENSPHRLRALLTADTHRSLYPGVCGGERSPPRGRRHRPTTW